MSAHSGGVALIRSDAVTNAAQRSPSLHLGRRLKREGREMEKGGLGQRAGMEGQAEIKKPKI